MTTIIGFDPIHMAIIIAFAGVMLHNLRVYKSGKGINWNRKTSASLTMFVASVYPVHQIISSPATLALDDPSQLGIVLAQIGSISGFAILGQKVFDKARHKVTNPPRREDPVAPKLDGNSWFKTNFLEGKDGNALDYGTAHLWVQVPNARSYVTAILKNDKGRILQIEQSSPGKNTVRLELFDSKSKHFSRGRYSLQIRADVGSGDSQGFTDEFEIV